jgi:hypothetical protein
MINTGDAKCRAMFGIYDPNSPGYAGSSSAADNSIVEQIRRACQGLLPTQDIYTVSADDKQIVVEFSTVSVAIPPLPGNYTLEQIAKDPDSYPAWGAWFPQTKVCKGGVPQIGMLGFFELSDVKTPDVGETKTTYEGVAPPNIFEEATAPPAWYNNVMIMDFARKCSGVRGNTCDGTATRHFKPLDNCAHPANEQKGEVESCQGPHPDLMKYMLNNGPVELEAADNTDPTAVGKGYCVTDTDCWIEGFAGICDTEKNMCYKKPTNAKLLKENELKCENYYGEKSSEPTERVTFESTYKFPRPYDRQEIATGICNPTPICSDEEDPKYSIPSKEDRGKWLIPSATCGSTGKCDRPVDPVDCGKEYNGQTSTEDETPVCLFRNPNNREHLESSKFECQIDTTSNTRIVLCGRSASNADPDRNQKACEACKNPSITTHMTGDWLPQRSPNGLCCGDDIGEGGFPYGILGVPRARSVSQDQAAAGNQFYYSTVKPGIFERNGEETCDDWVDINENGRLDSPLEEIDNDCDATPSPNCKDEACGSKTGPLGAPCCTLDPHCTIAFNGDQDVKCVNNGCNCLPADSSWNFGSPRTITSVPSTGYKYCIASSLKFPGPKPDRHFQINLDNNQEISVEFKDMDGENDCNTKAKNGEIELWVWEWERSTSSFSLKQQTGLNYIAKSSSPHLIALLNNVNEDCLVILKRN